MMKNPVTNYARREFIAAEKKKKKRVPNAAAVGRRTA
jgi:hypothetical protein